MKLEDATICQYMTGYQIGYQQGIADEQIQSIKYARMQATDYLDALDKAKKEAYQKGAKDFAEWLCNNADLSRIFITGFGNGNAVWNRDEIISVDEAIAEWKKGAEE